MNNIEVVNQVLFFFVEKIDIYCIYIDAWWVQQIIYQYQVYSCKYIEAITKGT